MTAKIKLKNIENCGVKSEISSITINSDDYDEKYMKIKFNSGDKSPLHKTIEIPSWIIVVTHPACDVVSTSPLGLI